MSQQNTRSSDQEQPTFPLPPLPTCRQLGELLIVFGDTPLFSGNTDWAITGFVYRPDGKVSTRATKVSPAIELRDEALQQTGRKANA